MATREFLIGRKDIVAFCGRSWKVLQRWIERGAPIVRIDGVWEADAQLLNQWRREELQRAAEGSEDVMKRQQPDEPGASRPVRNAGKGSLEKV